MVAEPPSIRAAPLLFGQTGTAGAPFRLFVIQSALINTQHLAVSGGADPAVPCWRHIPTWCARRAGCSRRAGDLPYSVRAEPVTLRAALGGRAVQKYTGPACRLRAQLIPGSYRER